MDFTTLLDNIYTQLDISKHNNIKDGIQYEPSLLKNSTRVIWLNVDEFLHLTNTHKELLFDFISSYTVYKISWMSHNVSDGMALHDNRITVNNINNIVKEYINTYIKCKECHKYNTTLEKNMEIKKYIRKCNSCLSSYSI